MTILDERKLNKPTAMASAEPRREARTSQRVSASAPLGFAGALAWRLRRNRPFVVATLLYGAASLVGLQFGWIHGDALVSSGIFFILVMGLDLLYGCAGMLSFAHVGFFGVGAYTVAILSATYGVSPWLGLLAALLINFVLSYALGRICLRLRGSYFMLGTLAFGIMVHAVITVAYPITGGDGGLGGIARPMLGTLTLGSDGRFGGLTWVIAASLFWLTLSLSRSRAGRALRAVRTEPVAAACLGVEVDRLKTNVFVLSSAYASVAGALFAMYHGAVGPDSFSLGVLLNVLLMLFLGGEGAIWGGLIGATFISILPDIIGPLQSAKELFNGILFSFIILAFPGGIAGGIEWLLARRKARGPVASPTSPAHVPMPPIEVDNTAHSSPILSLDGVSKRFGGVQAVDALSFSVGHGSVKGLIGPNGAGKSTLVNLISGVSRADTGAVRIGGRDLVGQRPDQIGRLGIQRTFQHERLFTHLDIVENVMVGHERGVRGSFAELFACALRWRSTANAELQARRAAEGWLAALGLQEHAKSSVAQLPTGLRRLVEVARACAARPQVLLLDETAGGLNDSERQTFRDIVRRLRAAGLSLILIEHDVDLVMELCDEVCVVNFGRRIADGTPAVVRQDAQVIAAYLGA